MAPSSPLVEQNPLPYHNPPVCCGRAAPAREWSSLLVSDLLAIFQRGHLIKTALHIIPLAACLLLPANASGQGTTYQTKYYVVHSDLAGPVVHEAALRMTLMVEEYKARTKGAAGKLTERLPFYLFHNPADYYRNGGMPGSVGVFTGDRLMAIAGEAVGDLTWHIVQHEGFHQFVRAVIRGQVPIWINEGLAEYFGEAIFTGDGYVTGLISRKRCARIKEMIRSDRFKTIAEMMMLTHSDWNMEMNFENYDMAWSMIHFLGHAQDGKYQSRFQKFLQSVSFGMAWEKAWIKNFGGDAGAFEEMWRKYWIELPEDPTPEVRARAITETLTGYLARAMSQRLRYDTADDFLAAAAKGRLAAHADDWLPSALLDHALAEGKQVGTWELRMPKTRTPKLVCTLTDGTEIVGTFRLKRDRVGAVSTSITGETEPTARRDSRRSPNRNRRARPTRRRRP